MTHLATYVRLLHRSEQSLADSLRVVGVGHAAEADVFHTAHLLADWSDEHTRRLEPIAQRLTQASAAEEPQRMNHPPIKEIRDSAVGLPRDLQDLYLLPPSSRPAGRSSRARPKAPGTGSSRPSRRSAPRRPPVS